MGQNHVKMGRNQAETYGMGQKGPNGPKSGPGSLKIGPNGPKSGSGSLKIGPNEPEWAEIRPRIP